MLKLNTSTHMMSITQVDPFQGQQVKRAVCTLLPRGLGGAGREGYLYLQDSSSFFISFISYLVQVVHAFFFFVILSSFSAQEQKAPVSYCHHAPSMCAIYQADLGLLLLYDGVVRMFNYYCNDLVNFQMFIALSCSVHYQ